MELPLPTTVGAEDLHVIRLAEVIEAIWRERRIELALEGERWPDLVRTGRVAAELGLPADRLHQALYPIPLSEIVVAPGSTQNPGYRVERP